MADPKNPTKKQRDDLRELDELLKQQPRHLRGIVGLWDSIRTAIIDTKSESKQLKKNSKEFKDISKKVLENTEDLHKATVSWQDITEKINTAIRSGNNDIAKRYKQMQQIQNYQKRYNNIVNAGANSIQKMVSSLESTIRGLPIIGDFIADAVNFDDLGKNILTTFRNQFATGGPAGNAISGGFKQNVSQGIVEGTSSGIVEANRPFKKLFDYLKKRVKGLSEVPKLDLGKMKKGLTGATGGFFAAFKKGKMFEGWNDFQKSFKGSGASVQAVAKEWKLWGKNATTGVSKVGQLGRGLLNVGKLLLKGLVAGALLISVGLLAKMVTSSAKFAFESGISLGQARKLGVALLINGKYVDAMAEEFGTINEVNAKTAWQLKKQKFFYGIQADQAVKILRIQTAISGQTSEQLIHKLLEQLEYFQQNYLKI